MAASGLAQSGPPPTRDFLGISPGRESMREARAVFEALRDDNEFDLRRLRGLAEPDAIAAASASAPHWCDFTACDYPAMPA